MSDYIQFWVAKAAVELAIGGAVIAVVLLIAVVDAFVLEPKRQKRRYDSMARKPR